MSGVAKFVVGCCVTFVVIAYVAYSVWDQWWYLSLIPANIQTAGALRISSETGGIKGCGVAVFRLAPESQQAILREGLQFFEHARQARGHLDAYDSYSVWNATPIVGGLTERSEFAVLLLGMSCASLDESLVEQIFDRCEQLGVVLCNQARGRASRGTGGGIGRVRFLGLAMPIAARRLTSSWSGP